MTSSCFVCSKPAFFIQKNTTDPKEFCSEGCLLIDGSYGGIKLPIDVMRLIMEKMDVIQLSELAVASIDALRILRETNFWDTYVKRVGFFESFMQSIIGQQITKVQISRLFRGQLFPFLNGVVNYDGLLVHCLERRDYQQQEGIKKVAEVLVDDGFFGGNQFKSKLNQDSINGIAITRYKDTSMSIQDFASRSIHVLHGKSIALMVNTIGTKSIVMAILNALPWSMKFTNKISDIQSLARKKPFLDNFNVTLLDDSNPDVTDALLVEYVKMNASKKVDYLLFNRKSFYPIGRNALVEVLLYAIEHNLYQILFFILKYTGNPAERFQTVDLSDSVIYAAENDFVEVIRILSKYLDTKVLWRITREYAGPLVKKTFGGHPHVPKKSRH